MTSPEQPGQNQLGEFLRARRGRLRPADVGLSMDYYIRLEQGKETNPSGPILGGLLAANPEGLALFAGIQDWPAGQRNTIRFTFLHPAARRAARREPRIRPAVAAARRQAAAQRPQAVPAPAGRRVHPEL